MLRPSPRDKLNAAKDAKGLAWVCSGWGEDGQPAELQLLDTVVPESVPRLRGLQERVN